MLNDTTATVTETTDPLARRDVKSITTRYTAAAAKADLADQRRLDADTLAEQVDAGPHADSSTLAEVTGITSARLEVARSRSMAYVDAADELTATDSAVANRRAGAIGAALAPGETAVERRQALTAYINQWLVDNGIDTPAPSDRRDALLAVARVLFERAAPAYQRKALAAADLAEARLHEQVRQADAIEAVTLAAARAAAAARLDGVKPNRRGGRRSAARRGGVMPRGAVE